MAPVAPWEADDDQLNALAQQLRQSTVECSALNERINKKNEEVAEYRKARDDAEARARMEEDRARALEAKATKALEDLKRERAVSRGLEDVLERTKDEAAKTAKSSHYLELELDSFASSKQSELVKERAGFEKRIAQLERQLQAASSQPSTSASVSRAQAQIMDLENKILALEHENTRLLDMTPATAVDFPFSSPTRRKAAPFFPSSLGRQSPTRAAEHDVFSTPLPPNARARNRPRSSSLNPDMKIARLEAEIARLTVVETESESLRTKLSKAQKDLLIAENDVLAATQRARREKEEMQDLLDSRNDELAELRYLLENQEVQQHDDDSLLREQLEDKERKLRAIRDGISSLEGRLVKRVEEVQAGIEERKLRSPIPAAVLSRPSSSTDAASSLTPASSDTAPLLDRIRSLEASLVEKEALLLAATNPAKTSDLDPREPTTFSTPLTPSSPEPSHHAAVAILPPYSAEDAVPRNEYEELHQQCVELENEVEERDAALENERKQASVTRRELSVVKAELMDVNMARTGLSARLVETQDELQDAQDHSAALQQRIDQLVEQLSALEVSHSENANSKTHHRLSDSELADLMTTLGRLRTERDEAHRSLSFLEAESNSQLDALEQELRMTTAHISRLEEEIAQKEALLATADSSFSESTRLISELEGKTRQSDLAQIALAIVVQKCETEREEMALQVETFSEHLQTLTDRHQALADDLDLERMHSADLQDRLTREQEHRSSEDGRQFVHDETDHGITIGDTTDHLFDVGEFETRHRSSSTSLVIEFDDLSAHPRPLSNQYDAVIGHAAPEPEEEEPSFSEAAFGFDPDPPSPARTGQSDRTFASSGALAHSSVGSRRSHSHHSSSPSRASRHHQLSPDEDIHAHCTEHIEELEARIERRNEQIGLHQQEINRLEMNLTLAEDANAEHLSEWEALCAERDQVALERDAMIADCAEARDARNIALRRIDTLDEELESLRGDLTRLQDQLVTVPAPESSSHKESESGYDLDQVAALVKEVIFATTKAQGFETQLAAAHDALEEACDLEGHLLDMQATRDELAQQLDSLSDDYDHLEAELRAKEEEIAQLQDAVTLAQSESSASLRQRDAAQDELQDLQNDLLDERQRLAAQMGSLQEQLANTQADQAASQQASDAEIHRLATEQRNALDTLAELRAENEHLQTQVEELTNQDREASEKLVAELEIKVANATAAKELTERALQDATASFQEQHSQLAARCEELEQAIVETIQSAEEKTSSALSELRRSHTQDLANAATERDAAISRAQELQDALQAGAQTWQAAEASAAEQLTKAAVDLDLMTSNYSMLQSKLHTALDSASANERALAATQIELQARLDELKRVNGMKRFVEMDLKKRESELASLQRQNSDDKAQFEQLRQRASALEIVNGTERARLNKEGSEIRSKLEAETTARLDIAAKLAASEERIKTLTKAQRKNELQINMLKEKLRIAQPQSTQPRPESSTQLRKASQEESRTDSASSWRRPTFMPHRTVSGSSERPASDASGSRTSLLSTAHPVATSRISSMSSRTSRDTLASRTVSASSINSVEPQVPRLHFAPTGPSVASTSSETGSLFGGIGKRKRNVEEDSENRRPAEPIVVPPSSPSRIRQLAERGLRTLTPKRSPRKKLAQLTEDGDDSDPLVPLALTNPFGMTGDEPGLTSKPLLFQTTGDLAPITRATNPTRSRVRLQDMLTSATNMDR